MRRAAAGWGVAVALVATSVGVGCGSAVESAPLQVEEPVLPPEDSSETEVPADRPPANEPPAADTGPILREVPACIPVKTGSSPPRFPQPCTVKRFWANGALASLQRFDTRGRPLESIDFYSTGSKHITEWLYDDTGRLELKRLRLVEDRSSSPGVGEQRHLYDSQGRLERIESYVKKHGEEPRWVSRYVHRYGEGGRLETIEFWNSDGLARHRSETFTYHPNGQLQRHLLKVSGLPPYMSSEEYDEQGRLLSTVHQLDESGSRESYTYDARGRRETMRSVHGSSQGESERLTRYQYDDSGKLVAEFAREDGDYPFSFPPYSVRKRELKWYVYSCTGDLLFEELDSNEDGVRDGVRELVRDAAGNLREERFEGTFVQPWRPLLRIEYDYACHEQAQEP
jgi:YD repeat-containing protein